MWYSKSIEELSPSIDLKAAPNIIFLDFLLHLFREQN